MASGLTTVVRTHTFRAYLSKRSHANLRDLLRQLTWLWNVALNERRQAWQREQRSVGYYEQCKVLTDTRRSDESWRRFPARAQRSVLRRLDRAFKGFFRRVKAGESPGFPRFKSEHRGVRSFSMPCPKIRSNGKWSRVTIKGVGRIKFRGTPAGTVKLLRIVRTPRRTVIQFVCEREIAIEPDTRPAVGVDLGVSARVALSTGERIPGVTVDRRELKRRQRKVARAKRGSRSRRKKVRMLAREWQRVRERERGALHELTTMLVREHSARFAVEDLRVPNMVRNRRLARRIAEQQWGALVHMLGYKAESAGGRVVRVDPRYTSQTCSACGHRSAVSIGLAVRRFRCHACGHEQDRDVNAAANILQRGLRLLNPGGLPGARGDQRAAIAASA